MHIKEELSAGSCGQEEVRRLAGDRYKRDGIVGYDRWGRQRGFVYIKDQRIPITLQRVRDTIGNREVTLSAYERFQQPSRLDEGLLRRVLHGLSCRNYRECVEAIPGALSLSPSTVSRRYIRASIRKLRELMDRRLEGYDFIGIVLNGKGFADGS